MKSNFLAYLFDESVNQIIKTKTESTLSAEVASLK